MDLIGFFQISNSRFGKKNFVSRARFLFRPFSMQNIRIVPCDDSDDELVRTPSVEAAPSLETRSTHRVPIGQKTLLGETEKSHTIYLVSLFEGEKDVRGWFV